MPEIDLEALLQPSSDGSPGGTALEYDPRFLEMEKAAAGKPEQQIGESTTAAQDPDWKAVRMRAMELAQETKDLRIAVYLVQALAESDGIPGVRDGLELVAGYLNDYWEFLHPELDADDDNDPTMRINALMALRSPDAVLRQIGQASLIRSPMLGDITFQHILVAQGEMPTPEGGEALPLAAIQGAFGDCDIEALTVSGAAARSAYDAALAIDRTLTELVGAEQALDLTPLSDLLARISETLVEQLSRRGVVAGPPGIQQEPAIADGERQASNSEAPSVQKGVSMASAPSVSSAPGQLQSRADVVATLDLVCRYYANHEPASPVPLMLERAKRLVNASFVELVRELAPAGLSQAETISGSSKETPSGAD